MMFKEAGIDLNSLKCHDSDMQKVKNLFTEDTLLMKLHEKFVSPQVKIACDKIKKELEN